jgi:hypothetical protein
MNIGIIDLKEKIGKYNDNFYLNFSVGTSTIGFYILPYIFHRDSS